MGREIRVELKHTLSRVSWNHKVEDLDYVVCWENRWPAFQNPLSCCASYWRRCRVRPNKALERTGMSVVVNRDRP